MLMKIIKNPDNDIYERITQAVEDSGGYCPCVLSPTEDTKCICKKFREQNEAGECH